MLKAEFPELIYCSVTPFGQTGPYARFKGNSLTAMALSGLMYITGDPDKEPLCTGGEPAEYFGALHAWVAILAALEYRAANGGGQHIDVSMLEALGCADEYNTTMYAYLGAIRKRFYSRHAIPTYPSEIFPCRDGNIVVIGGATGFPLMMAILVEQPELETNPLFQNLWLRFMQWEKFEEILRPYLAEHDWEDLLTRAQELRIPFAAVLDAKTLLENEHLRERGFFEEVEHPERGQAAGRGAPVQDVARRRCGCGRCAAAADADRRTRCSGSCGYEAEDQLDAARAGRDVSASPLTASASST